MIVIILLALILMVSLSALVRAKAELAELHAAGIDGDYASARQMAAAKNERVALRAILDGVGEGLLALDSRRRVVLANPRFSQMFGIAGDLTGRPLSEVIRISAVFAACDEALAGKEPVERFTMSSDGSERRIEIRALPLNSEQIAAVALFIDVSQLEHLEQVRRDFISDFSHEVRTPLAGLSSAVESFELGTHSADDDRQLRRIMTRQLKRLQRLVDDLSELSRIEAGDVTLNTRGCDLRELIDDVCEDFADRASQKNLRFVIAGDHANVIADPVRIQQAFSNLVDNAIKYGGSDSTIDIAITKDADAAVVRLTDHGEGIPVEEREAVFRRFYRIDKSRSQEVAGTGLGLAITKHLILAHRGSIDLESEPGRGSTFIVRLPLAEAGTL
jgi:two-component system phosphate regulon sensor histidine kinase PhoR